MVREKRNDLKKYYLHKKKDRKNVFLFHGSDFENVKVITISISTEKEFKLCNFEF